MSTKKIFWDLDETVEKEEIVAVRCLAQEECLLEMRHHETLGQKQ